MKKKKLLKRIILNPNIMSGKPSVRKTGLTVQSVLDLLAKGKKPEEVLDKYEKLTYEDIQACLLFARETMNNLTLVP